MAKTLIQPASQKPQHLGKLPAEMQLFVQAVLLLTGLSLLYCLFMRFFLHLGYPYDWPFFIPTERFGDFRIFIAKFAYFGRAEFFTHGFPINYPAPMVVLYQVFFKLGGTHALRFFLSICLLAYIVPAALFAKSLWARGLKVKTAVMFVAVCLVLSWPALLLLDRANVEVLVWIAVAGGVWAFATDREWLAAILFGVAGSLKLFPFILLALFFRRGKLPKFLCGAAVGAFLIYISLYIVGPTVAIANRGLNAGLEAFRTRYMAVYLPEEGGLDHSILAFVKAIIVSSVSEADANRLTMRALEIYTPVMAVLTLGLYFLIVRKLPWRNQILALIVIGTYFTPFSGDGTLIHLYGPFALCCLLAVEAHRRGVVIPGLRKFFLCFAWLFSIESFFVIQNHRFEAQFKCIAMGVLLVLSMRYPLDQVSEAEE